MKYIKTLKSMRQEGVRASIDIRDGKTGAKDKSINNGPRGQRLN